MEEKTIYDMEIGEVRTIINLNKFNKRKYERFLDLGIAPNANVKLIKKISFNRLYIIEVDDVEICIRNKDAKNILVI